MATEEERAIAREVPRLVARLALRVGRRLARVRSGRPWLRRALRDSLATGGVPFRIPHRAPKRETTRVVVLLDVSWSVARASGLFLLLAARFLELGRRARIVAFVDRPVDATAAIARWTGGRPSALPPPAAGPRGRGHKGRPGEGIECGGISFAAVLDGLHGLNLEAPSDYGRTFHALRSARALPHGRDAVLVIVGDGRTNRFDPLAWALDDIARRFRSVLWLVSEPQARWGTADSALRDYLRSVDVAVEATDLTGLADGLAEMARRL
jgi:uncharacterized protein with von Willebrand factor type A (vWA) domain